MPKRLAPWVAETWHENAFRVASLILNRSKVDLYLEEQVALLHPKQEPGEVGPGRPRTRTYTIRAMLMAETMCLLDGKQLTIPNFLHIIWHMSPEQLADVGMTGQLPDADRARMDDLQFRSNEYDRFVRRYDEMFSVIDPSPHRRMFHERNAVRMRRVAGLSAARKAELNACEDRLVRVHTLIIGAGCEGARPRHYRGHVQLDETWVDAWATVLGTGTRPAKMGSADPEAAYRFDKVEKYPLWVHMFVLTQMATMPYERRVPNVITGFRARKARGETDVEAAIAAIRMHIENGFGPLSNRPARIYTDEGHSNKLSFAPEMIKYRYLPVAPAKQKPPREGFILPEGAFLISARVCCAAARHLLQHRFLEPLDPGTATPEQLRERQDIIDEITPFIMPTNGVPYIYPLGHKLYGKARITVICPGAVPTLDCPLVPSSADPTGRLPFAYNAPSADLAIEERPVVCRTTYSTLIVDTKFLKHIDQYLRGSFEHADHMMNIRSTNERSNASAKRRDIGGFQRDTILMMGRARVSVAFALICAIVSIREMESIASNGNIDKLPYTPRLAASRRRNAIIAEERRRNP